MDFESVRNIIADTLGCDMDSITMEARIKEDLGADSLDAVELVMAIEEASGLIIDDTVTPTLVTVGDVMAFLEANQA